MAIEAAAGPHGGGAPLYRTPLTAAAPAKPNHCPEQEEEQKQERHCLAPTSPAEEEEEKGRYTWAPPSASYPCPAGWYSCDICPERRRTDQGKKPRRHCNTGRRGGGQVLNKFR